MRKNGGISLFTRPSVASSEDLSADRRQGRVTLTPACGSQWTDSDDATTAGLPLLTVAERPQAAPDLLESGL
jgi:hypothetical protein